MAEIRAWLVEEVLLLCKSRAGKDALRDGGAVNVLEGWKGEEHARRSGHSGSAGDTGNLEANTASMHFLVGSRFGRPIERAQLDCQG
ncbi:unnamed protein product [Chondrus crispus]|uniref:Uncharacterized protein n=1 Tax=Chondrus crispus TaxID=2769 RepID=R7Q7K9_CHOCR|nr:unnamed protein product [Chondrus crispus]CDF33376.1 unnamed protein product [Chondrus crispus]|eukprot:XP_005713179.1 unnamed protein product [Chondrus crispus]